MQIREDFLNPVFYRSVLFGGVRIVAIIIFAYLATKLADRLIGTIRKYAIRVMLKTEGGMEYEIQKHADTIGDVARTSIIGFVWVIASMMILKELNFDVRPLLAGAGILGVAVGFGAQTLVKDVLSGFFMLMENQIRINDVAVINGVGGLVEAINLRTTVLRSEDGAVHVFPNGGINKLSNLTRQFSYAVLTLTVDYQADTDRVMSAINEIAAELAIEETYKGAILAPLEMMGVDQLTPAGVVIKARFKTLPMKQWMVGREMNRRIKKRFGELGIDLASPAPIVHITQDRSSPA